jgi:hypothetical protein
MLRPPSVGSNWRFKEATLGSNVRPEGTAVKPGQGCDLVSEEVGTKVPGRAPEEASGRAGVPTPAPVSLDLDLFLEAATWEIPGAGAWEVPVPAPFAARGGRLVAFPGPPDPKRSFRPRETPWLASEFAHLWTLGASRGPQAAERAALDFAEVYGLTGPWTDGLPPTERPIRSLVAQSLRLHQALAAWRELTSGEPIEPEQAKRAAAKAWGVIKGVPLPQLQIAPSFGVVASYPEPLDLLDIMRLQLMTDFLSGRPVRECEFISGTNEPCGKLFIWTEGSTGSRIRGRGSPPKFCSRRHAAAAGQRERRRRAKEKGDNHAQGG